MEESKKCSCCKVVKDRGSFHRSAGTKDGLVTACKACVRLKSAKWYSVNAERAKQKTAVWRSENPERARESQASWRATNSEKKRAMDASWRENNRERCAANRAEWCMQNRDKIVANAKRWIVINRDRCLALRAARARNSINNLSDTYVGGLLGWSSKKDFDPALISLKREQLEIHRLTKQLKEVLSNATTGESK